MSTPYVTNRASESDIINALTDCEIDEDVCEICANIVPREDMRSTWVGSRTGRREGVPHCKDCTVEGGAA